MKGKEQISYEFPDKEGHFGKYGGRFVPETLMSPLEELEHKFLSTNQDKGFWDDLDILLTSYAGRPSPLFYAKRLSEHLGFKVYLKREDLNHTGSHKFNNTLGQVILAQKMGKKRIIAETGAGQHGVATATACALMGIECEIYMGSEDIRRQAPNVWKIELLGAKVIPVDSGRGTLKDAINEALRDWVTNVDNTYYLLGSAVGPHPYPLIVRQFQSIIGRETKKQFLQAEGKLPDHIIACVGGGSNAIGMFHPFVEESTVKLTGVEAGGIGPATGENAARIGSGSPGVLHGTMSYLLQDEHGQVADTHSISAGLDYPLIGPEHSMLCDQNRISYTSVSDSEALDAFYSLSHLEGIVPALESAHALAYCEQLKGVHGPEDIVVVNLSGRGDKDVEIVRNI